MLAVLDACACLGDAGEVVVVVVKVLVRCEGRHIQCLSTSKPIPDRTAPKPNNDAQADDYQSQGIVVRPSEKEPDDDPTSDHDHSEP